MGMDAYNKSCARQTGTTVPGNRGGGKPVKIFFKRNWKKGLTGRNRCDILSTVAPQKRGASDPWKLYSGKDERKRVRSAKAEKNELKQSIPDENK